MRGRRSYNEDNVYCKIATVDGDGECGEIVCVGVFDGHGGPKASEYVQKHLFENILSSESFPADVFKAIEDGFVWTDSKYNKLDERQRNDDGCTATAAMMIHDTLYVSHVGDSRAVLGQRRKNSEDVIAIPLTDDHKPNRRDERSRIENVGGTVMLERGE
jgi:protein phosphatase 1L